ncbi:peptidase M75 family protein [Corynebacterium sp. sy017]|uniref:iron uptake system protein EfeO n=1 Tax=unclassified Corynebacterium TaxID=2624378 RepID=UPI00118727DC|nr:MULTISPECIES: iron uptake system protein EfeO [unclassified Corynebacterium]MBP3088719.1 peptidase M75 family protein [Corynebacterium sp. sy017]TSD92003.1 peptidase M75 family protein [Corynebacterium sp. SY003]
MKKHLIHTALPLVVSLSAASALSACVANNPENTESSAKSGTSTIDVKISDDTCDVAADSASSGRVSFSLSNTGTVRNEFEILAEDQLRIVGERENLGPGTKTDYTLVLEPGTYYTACKKNMVGKLVDVRPFTVNDSGEKVAVSADEQELITNAVTNYTAYVRDQTGQLLEETKAFAAFYKAGDVEKARMAYAPTRAFYERIEPTAEAFGDIDPALDERETDHQESDDAVARSWTGWHVIEKDLWRPEGYAGLSVEEATHIADQLVADTQKLYDLVYSDQFTVNIDDISNGAIGLLEEVATTKITGEEEIFSHTDLYDFFANVEGAKVAFGNVEALAKQKDAQLADTISARFDEIEKALDKYRTGDGFASYTDLDDKQRRELSDKVDALRVPLAKLTEAIIS